MDGNCNSRRAFLKKTIGLTGIIGLAVVVTSLDSCQKTNDVYTVKQSLCTDCKKCLSVCLANAISISNNKASISSSSCIGCGHCVRVCAAGAISQA